MILQLEEAEKNARLARKSAREQGKILMKIACSKEFFQYTVYYILQKIIPSFFRFDAK
jgi:hypothetical protein